MCGIVGYVGRGHEAGQVIIEKYDDSGRLLKVTPPGYLPLSEVV